MKKTGKIEKLCCAHCAALIQEKIAQLDGVQAVSISFITQRIAMQIEEDKEEAIATQAQKIVKSIEPDSVLTF